MEFTDPVTKEKTIVPDISFDAKGTWIRKEEFLNPATGETVPLTVTGTVFGIEKSVSPEGTKRLNFPGWVAEDGKWIKDKALFRTKDGGTVELELTSIVELEHEILTSSDKKGALNESILKSLTVKLFGREIDDKGNIYRTFGGMYEKNHSNKLWGDNMILVPDENGELKPKDSAAFVVSTIGDSGNFALVGWIDLNGNNQVRIIKKSGLDNPSNFNSWYSNHKHQP